MEAPEKIYFGTQQNTANPFFGLTHKCADTDIEYTRTDAFIKKAEDFIRRKICDHIVHYNYGPNNDMETMYVDNRFFEDFKKYMKGE